MNTAQTLRQPRRSVSVFGPVILIGIGVIWLMANQGMIVQNPLEALLRFWPLLLIVAGIELIFSRTGYFGTLVSALLGIAVIGAAVVYLTTPGESVTPIWFGWNFAPQNAPLSTTNIAQPLDNTKSLQVELHLPGGIGSIKPTTNAVNLMEGQVTTYGNLTNRVSRSGDSVAVLLETNAWNDNWLNLFLVTQRWDVRLNPQVPLALHLEIGSGTHDFDLRTFTVKDLVVHQGSGVSTFHLPASEQYHFGLDVGSGIANLALPQNTPARVTYNIGSGWLNVNGMHRVSGTNDHGVYETNGFNNDSAFVSLNVELGSGLVAIR